MNTELFAKLTAQGKRVHRNAELIPSISTGCMVTILRPDLCSYHQFQPYSLEPVQTISKPGPVAHTATIHLASASSAEEKVARELPFECFRYMGMDIKQKHWQRGGKFKKAKCTKISASVFEYYQSKEDASRKIESITEERYNYFFEVLPPLMINVASLTSAVFQENEKQLPYRITRKEAFAVSEAYTHTPKTVVLTVCWQESYEHLVDDEGWVPYQPDAFFSQEMQVFAPNGRPIFETYNHYYGNGYKVAPYYSHSRRQREVLGLYY